MNVFHLHEVTADLRSVLYWCHLCDHLRTQGRGSQPFTEETYTRMLADVVKFRDTCARAGFISTAQRIGLIHQRLDLDKSRVDASYIAAELLNIYDAFLEIVVRKKFLTVSMARAGCIDNHNLMGPEILKAFPNAQPDILQAGNCLAAECQTAAVFHLMRVVEWGLRAFGAHLGFKQLRIVKKSGVVKLVPIDFLEWEKILGGLQARADQRIEQMRPGRRKQSAQEFYYPALQDIRGIRDAWRNHTMHNRREFSPQDADAIFGHVKRLMTTLATRVSQT